MAPGSGAKCTRKTSDQPVYRYYYARPRPTMRPAEAEDAVASSEGAAAAPQQSPPPGAVHSAEIEYALGNLPTNRVYDWQPEDYQVSESCRVTLLTLSKPVILTA